MTAFLAGLIAQAVLLVAFAPLLAGLLAHTAARGAGRPAPRILQEVRDLLKEHARAGDHGSGDVAALYAPLALGLTVTAGLLIPTVVRQAPLSGSGDLVALILLLGLGRAAAIRAAVPVEDDLAAFRVGRDAAIGAIGEPILFLGVLAVALTGHSTGLDALAGATARTPLGLAHLPAFIAAAGIALLDGRRLSRPRPPMVTGFGIPRCDLAQAPEAAGPRGALLRLAVQVRHLVILSTIVAVFLPPAPASPGATPVLSVAAALLVYGLKVAALGTALRLVDCITRRQPMRGRALICASLLAAVLALIMGGIAHA